MQLSMKKTAVPASRAAGMRAAVLRRAPTGAPARRERVVAAGFVEDAINALTVAIKESPLNKGKVALAKMQAGEYDAAAVKAKLDGIIQGSPVVVFSFSSCPFCIKAKGLLSDLGASYQAIELDQMGKEGLQLRAELAQATDRTSMPSVWIKGDFVGGCNDGPGVVPLNAEGKLVPMLKAAGALP